MSVKGAREKFPWAHEQTLNQQIEEPSRQPLRRIARALRPPATARFFRRATGSWRGVLPIVAVVLAWATPAVASGGMGPVSVPTTPLTSRQLAARLVLWAVLFSMGALLAGAETAITTLWPWKVKRLAAEEGKSSPFTALQNDITKVLTTALVGVTFCTVYGTALATDIAIQAFGHAGVGYATIALTITTLVLGEIVPKSIAVAKAESVARATLPFINLLNILLYPVTALTSLVNRLLLRLSGLSGSEDSATAVTQPELRLILTGAKKSGAVELYEQDMIEGVLDMQTTKVGQILTPRVDIQAIKAMASLEELRQLVTKTGYTRIPVYNDTVDEIIGVVLSRDLLEVSGRASANLDNQTVSTIMERIPFVPETMTVMNALKAMRRDRLHMMVVVDEFGGTLGLVTLEDTLETLVGEIYDEDDDEEVEDDITSIVDEKNGSFLIDATADLDMVCKKLDFEVSEEVLENFLTISGYLCQQAGRIPEKGDRILVGDLRFDVCDADERRLLSVRASRVNADTAAQKPGQAAAPKQEAASDEGNRAR